MKAVDRRALSDRVTGAFKRLSGNIGMIVELENDLEPEEKYLLVLEFIEDVEDVLPIVHNLRDELQAEVEEYNQD